MGPKHSDDDLDLLTDEEREGLLADDIVDEGLETDDETGDANDDVETGGDAGTEAEAEAADGDAGQDDGAAQVAADAAAEQTDAIAATAADEPDAGSTEAEGERIASWALPPEVNQKIEELDKARDALSEQFDDGELTAKEYREQLKPLEKELDALKERRTTANVQRDIAISTFKEVTVPAFLEAHPQYADTKSPLYGMLDNTLRGLQQTSRDPLSPKLLEQAHKQISSTLKKALGISEIPKPKAATPNAGKPAAKREIPPTLANVPAADISDADDGGEFAFLDRLAAQDTEKFESALAKMSDDARERYLAQ